METNILKTLSLVVSGLVSLGSATGARAEGPYSAATFGLSGRVAEGLVSACQSELKNYEDAIKADFQRSNFTAEQARRAFIDAAGSYTRSVVAINNLGSATRDLGNNSRRANGPAPSQQDHLMTLLWVCYDKQRISQLGGR